MKWTIDKSFSFCYGHRVHNQRLNTEFTESGNACLACRHLHGHEGLVKVFLTGDADNIESTGMVTDFKHLGWMKNFLDDTLDHKFIMDIQDPLIGHEFKELTDKDGHFDKKFVHKMPEGYYIPNMDYIAKYIEQEDIFGSRADAILEKYEGAILVDFVPTSENLAGWLLQITIKKMKPLSGVQVVAIEYWETPKSHCRVEA